MNILEFIISEMTFADEWTRRLAADMPEQQWQQTPDNVGTNINWLLGHIVISNYFHSIASIVGITHPIKDDISLRKYNLFYGRGSVPTEHQDRKPNKERLLHDLTIVKSHAVELIQTLNANDLDVPTMVDNPIATTKFEALTFAPKHQMWHCGQIALVHRAMGVGNGNM